MNRRTFLTAIPAAVAALTASKSLAGAMSPVDAPAAIAEAYQGTIGSDEMVPIFPDAGGFYQVLVGEDGPEILHFSSGDIAVIPNYWTLPSMTYVAPRGVE